MKVLIEMGVPTIFQPESNELLNSQYLLLGTESDAHFMFNGLP